MANETSGIQTTRLEAFSDGVFAIAITLLIIEVHLAPGDGPLSRRLLQAWPEYVAYVVSFITIGVMWANHHSIFHMIARSTHAVIVMNLLLLLFISFVPFPTSVLGEALGGPAREARVAAVFYNGTFIVIAIFFNVLWHTAVRQGLIPPASRRAAALVTRSYALGPPSYLAATLASIRSAELGLAINGFLILLYWFTPRAPLISSDA